MCLIWCLWRINSDKSSGQWLEGVNRRFDERSLWDFYRTGVSIALTMGLAIAVAIGTLSRGISYQDSLSPSLSSQLITRYPLV